MHRLRSTLAARVPPGRARQVATAVERSGIAATYRLHDRVLANRDSRRRYRATSPQLDDVQRTVLAAVNAEGYATVSFADLIADKGMQASVEEQGAAFVAETQQGLEQEQEGSLNQNLRRRKGKEFLVRAHSFDGTRLGLDHAWLRAALSARMLDVANAYLDMWSKLSYVDLWYTVPQPQSAERVASQLWHFDFDDKHLLKAFLYLDDVDTGSGPLEYVAGSHPGGPYHQVRPWKPMNYGRVPEEEVQAKVPEAAVRTFTAKRGTLIFCNTSGLHRGGFAKTGPRVLATATYCSPASLAALSQRNYELDPDAAAALGPAARFAAS